jgi:hypothetical protein
MTGSHWAALGVLVTAVLVGLGFVAGGSLGEITLVWAVLVVLLLLLVVTRRR